MFFEGLVLQSIQNQVKQINQDNLSLLHLNFDTVIQTILKQINVCFSRGRINAAGDLGMWTTTWNIIFLTNLYD